MNQEVKIPDRRAKTGRMKTAPQGVGSTARGLTHRIDTTDWRATVNGTRTPRTLTPINQRFWPKVDTSAGPKGCWEWSGHRTPDGYGQIGRGRRADGVEFAHRVAYELNHGPIPEGMLVCHRCDNPPCVNPGHLFLGTAEDNSHDARAKGRLVIPDLRGEEAAPAVLAESQALAIIARRAAGERLGTLAAEYGVAQSTISSIATGKTWAHLTRKRTS